MKARALGENMPHFVVVSTAENNSTETVHHSSPYIIKSPRSGVTLCFQFVSAASATATAATAFASYAKTFWATS